MKGITNELFGQKSKDRGNLVAKRESDQILELMSIAGQVEIRKIKAAIIRIDAGEYGYCGTCGTEISQERLDLIPYTPFCKACTI